MKRGILYIATGKSFVEEASKSRLSLKQTDPDLPACLITDKESASIEAAKNFDTVQIIDNPTYTWQDKLIPLKNSPYEQTLFLDTDTLVIDSVEEMFETLDHFEIGYAHASFRAWNDYNFGVPISFAEPNSGMILYKKSERFDNFVDAWFERYVKQVKDENGKYGPDQPTFRYSLYVSDLRLVVFPPEYNWRTIFPGYVGGAAKAKILHGREPTLSHAAKKINASNKPRVFDFPKQVIAKRALLKLKSKLKK